jgi:folylpolyglutamate synthase/dihydropteroate synthase
MSEISSKRVLELCLALGRVNIGLRCVVVPEGGAGHAIAVMLESVLKSSGHSVGRITSVGAFDSRASVYINGEIPAIEDYNSAVAALKSAAKRDPEAGYTREETTFVLGLLLAKTCGCEYVILEGLSGKDYSLDSVCAPYDLIVMPTVYDSETASERVKVLGDAIRRGTREVVSGNQKSEIYNVISNACAISGVRLYIPLKAQFEVGEVTARKLIFSYSGRDGFMLKSPSYLLRDCAMTVIESALAIRRGGVKIPWSDITAGLSLANETLCFDMLAISPLILVDSASNVDEAAMLLKTAEEALGEKALNGIAIAIPKDLINVQKVFENKGITQVMVLSDSGDDGCYDSVKKLSGAVVKSWRSGVGVICLGGAELAANMKDEILKLVNG